jgi:hypothetical protein
MSSAVRHFPSFRRAAALAAPGHPLCTPPPPHATHPPTHSPTIHTYTHTHANEDAAATRTVSTSPCWACGTKRGRQTAARTRSPGSTRSRCASDWTQADSLTSASWCRTVRHRARTLKRVTHVMTHTHVTHTTHALHTHSLTHSLTLSLAHSLTLTHSLAHSLTHARTHACTHSLTRSLNHLLTHLRTH